MKYVAYNGEDREVSFHSTEEEAQAALKQQWVEGFEAGDGIEDSFIAKVVSRVKVE